MKLTQNQGMNPGLFAKQSMRQAFMILTLPIEELGSYMQQELEQNPLFNWDEHLGEYSKKPEDNESLKFNDNDFYYLNHWEGEDYLMDESELKKSTPIVPYIETCFEDLMRQFKEYSEDPNLINSARNILGNLDSHGLLDVQKRGEFDKQALDIIKKIEPKGLASSSLQEAFLEQLSDNPQGKAYLIIKDYWDDLTKGDFKRISKKFKMNQDSILSLLRQHLVLPYLENDRKEVAPVPTWDLEIKLIDDQFDVKINEDPIQKFSLNLQYYHQNSSFIEKMKNEMKWVLKNLKTRYDLLKNIGVLLVKTNASYFKGQANNITSLNVTETADHLSIHPSTLYRIIKGKWINTPRGLLHLRSFFKSIFEVQEIILLLIKNEDHPYTDDELVDLLQKEGHTLSRRAVAKCRQSLNIPSSRKR